MAGFSKISQPKLKIGRGVDESMFIEADLGLGSANPKIRFNSSTDIWEVASDGVTYSAIVQNLLTVLGKSFSDSPISVIVGQAGICFVIDTSLGAVSVQLPAPSSGFNVSFKDKKGTFNWNPLTLLRAGSERIEDVAASLVIRASYFAGNVFSDGTDYFVGVGK